MAARRRLDHEPRRRPAVGRRAAARRRPHAGRVPRRARRTGRVAAAAAVRPVGRSSHRPARPAPARHHRGRGARRRPGRSGHGHRPRRRTHRPGARGPLPHRHRRDVRGQHDQHPGADARRASRPRGRQRPRTGRVHRHEPAGRAADRRGAVRLRAVLAGRRRRGAHRRGHGADLACASPGTRARGRRAPAHLGGRRRGRALGAAPRRGPHAGADDPHLQRDVRGRVVGAGALRARAPGPRGGGVRTDHHGGGAGRPRGRAGVRLADQARHPREPHAHRPGHRDPHPPVPGADHHALGRDGDLLRLRSTRVRVGHHVDHRPAARRAHRAPGAGGQRQPRRSVRRTRRGRGTRRRTGAALRGHGAVLVRVRGLRGVRRADLAPAPAHPTRRRARRAALLARRSRARPNPPAGHRAALGRSAYGSTLLVGRCGDVTVDP